MDEQQAPMFFYFWYPLKKRRELSKAEFVLLLRRVPMNMIIKKDIYFQV